MPKANTGQGGGLLQSLRHATRDSRLANTRQDHSSNSEEHAQSSLDIIAKFAVPSVPHKLCFLPSCSHCPSAYP